MTKAIFLVGARGSGKTTIGQELAKKLVYHFVDADQYLQQTAGMNIAEIVAQEGWREFRQREIMVLKKVTQPSTLIATGGGVILAQENRQFMRQYGTVIYLYAPASILEQRLKESPNQTQRPSLTGRSAAEEIADVLAERENLYRETAHHMVDATPHPSQIIDTLLNLLQHNQATCLL